MFDLVSVSYYPLGTTVPHVCVHLGTQSHILYKIIIPTNFHPSLASQLSRSKLVTISPRSIP